MAKGGKRTGAGRPAKIDGVHTLLVRLDQSRMHTLERYQTSLNVSRAEVIRQGLDALDHELQRQHSGWARAVMEAVVAYGEARAGLAVATGMVGIDCIAESSDELDRAGLVGIEMAFVRLRQLVDMA